MMLNTHITFCVDSKTKCSILNETFYVFNYLRIVPVAKSSNSPSVVFTLTVAILMADPVTHVDPDPVIAIDAILVPACRVTGVLNSTW